MLRPLSTAPKVRYWQFAAIILIVFTLSLGVAEELEELDDVDGLVDGLADGLLLVADWSAIVATTSTRWPTSALIVASLASS